MSNNIRTLKFTLPARWASTLINGDSSGISTAEAAEITRWLEHQGIANWTLAGMSDKPWFARRHDGGGNLGGLVAEFTFTNFKP